MTDDVRAPVGPAAAMTRSTALLVLSWVSARVLVAVVYVSNDFAGRSIAWGDLALYERWADQILTTGAMPDGETWMYPPLTALVLLGVDAFPGPFGTWFVLTMLLVDLAVLLLLVGALRRGGHPAGAWAWVVLVPLLGLIGWARLDMLPVAAAAGSLLLAARHPVLAGALAAAGTAVKGWPVVLGLLFLDRPRWVISAVVTGSAVAAVTTLLLQDTWTFLTNLSGRGIQVESVMALPWTLRQALGYPVEGDFQHGSYEVLEPGTAVLARTATVVMVVAVGAALVLSRRRAPALRWYAAVTALLAASPLLSTQFVLWLIGGVVVAATLPGADGAVARRTLPLVTVIVVLTHLTFPLQWGGLVGDGRLAATTLLGRNVLLLVLAVWLLLAVRGGARPRDLVRAGSVAAASPVPAATGPRPHQRETGSPASSDRNR